MIYNGLVFFIKCISYTHVQCIDNRQSNQSAHRHPKTWYTAQSNYLSTVITMASAPQSHSVYTSAWCQFISTISSVYKVISNDSFYSKPWYL